MRNIGVLNGFFEESDGSLWRFGGVVAVQCVANVGTGRPSFGDQDHATDFRFILAQRKAAAEAAALSRVRVAC